MTTYIIINAIVTLCLIVVCGYIVYSLKKNNDNPIEAQAPDTISPILAKESNWKIYTLLLLAFLVVVFSFFSPFIFTRSAATQDFNYLLTGQIGDTIGGLMNPFITLAGVIVTGLAFYIQYKANQQQKVLFLAQQNETKEQLQAQIDNQNSQTRLQQFESQFYEMLRLHRENINEMKIEGYNYEVKNDTLNKIEKTTEGRKVFVTMQTELEFILSIFTKYNKLNKIGFQKCYDLFFAGLDDFSKNNTHDPEFIEELYAARMQHEGPAIDADAEKHRKKYSDQYLYINYKPFSGHSSRLGHYFRHLYLMVKSIVNSETVTDYNEKMKYLKLLRAQLSNHEQILLFYNWLSDYGKGWENDKHLFFSEFCMIHNLWYNNLFDDEYISNSVKSLRNKPVNMRKGNMFEIDSA